MKEMEIGKGERQRTKHNYLNFFLNVLDLIV